MYMKTDGEVILLRHCRIEMKIEGTLRIISIYLVFDFHYIMVCFLFSVLEFKVVCYLS